MTLFSEQQLRDMSRKQVHALVRHLEERVFRQMAQMDHVYVQTDDGSAWCARHWGVILHADTDTPHCAAFDESEDKGRCQPVPLYVEAPDP